MSQRATTIRFVAGGAIAAIVGAGVLSVSFAADVATGCSAVDAAGDAQVPATQIPPTGAPTPDGYFYFTALAVAGDGAGLTAQVRVVALQDYTTALFNGDRHDFAFTANGKAVVLGSRRFISFPSLTYPATSSVSVGGAAVAAASYKVVYDHKASTITYNLSAADLKTILGAEPAGLALTNMSAKAYAKTSPDPNSDILSDTASVAAALAYNYGGVGCAAAPGPAPSATATAAPSGSASPTPSGSASPKPSSSATPTATAVPSGSPAPGTTMRFSGPTRVQFGDTFTTTVTLTSASGQPLSGKKVTGKHGTSPVATGTTNAAGQAKITIAARDKAGKRNLVVTFAGDSGNPPRTLNRAITTVLEATRLGKAVAGTGSTRTVTVQLTDDDPTKKALAGRNVTFRFSSRTVTVRTDSTGRAKVTAGTGAAMDITFSGESGAYAPVLLRTYAS